MEATRELRLLRPVKLHRLVSDSFVCTSMAYFLCWSADSKISSFVPETSRYTLEELQEVFSKDTRTIVRKGRAQLKWLITGVGERRGNHGRWVRSEYPSLVPRGAFRDEQELEDIGGLATQGNVTNGAVAAQGTGATSRRHVNTGNGAV